MAHKKNWTKFFTDLLVLVLAYVIFIFVASLFTFIFIFFQPSEWNTFTILSLCMDHVHITNIFRFQLCHHTSLIKLTLLQLHHRTPLAITMLITRDPFTPIARALLTFATRAHYIHDTFSKLPLFHSTSRFILQCLFTYKFNPFFNFVIYHLLSPHPLISPTHLPSPNTSGTLRLFHFSPTTSGLTQVRVQLIKTQCFAAHVPTKSTVEFNRIWHLPAPPRIAMHDAIKHVMVSLFIKLVMQKTLVALDTSPPCPTPPSLKSPLDQGLSPADAKISKEKCAKSSAALRSNTVPVRCSVCAKGFHQKCSTGPKASTRDSH